MVHNSHNVLVELCPPFVGILVLLLSQSHKLLAIEEMLQSWHKSEVSLVYKEVEEF